MPRTPLIRAGISIQSGVVETRLVSAGGAGLYSVKGRYYRGEKLPSTPGQAALTFTRGGGGGGGGGGRAKNVERASLEGVVLMLWFACGRADLTNGVRGIRSGC